MSIQDIQAAITELPEGELESLMAWMEECRAEAWDRQIAQDVEAGRLAGAGASAAAGRAVPAGL